MREANLFQSIRSFLSGLSSRTHEFIPSCNVYLRPDGIWIFPIDDWHGGLGVMNGPAETGPKDVSDQLLGEAIIKAISRARLEKNYKKPLPDTKAAESAGFKSHGDLEKSASLLAVSKTAEGFKVSAWAASKGDGYESVAGAEQSCSADPASIGNAIRELSSRCVPREVKASKRKGSKTVDRPATSDSTDLPISFGYKISWIAVRSSSGREVADFLGLKKVAPCSWKQGLEWAHESKGVFVSPALDGWTLAVGRLPEAGEPEFLELLEDLSDASAKRFTLVPIEL
jgi:hypothetical protein